MSAALDADFDLSPYARAEARFRAKRIESRTDLGKYLKLLSPELESGDHLEEIRDAFDSIEKGKKKLICISVPPQHGKTTMILHGCVRRLDFNRRARIGYASYNSDIAKKKSRDARKLAIAAGIELSEERDAAQEWETPEGGSFKAGGLAAFTSLGIDLMVVDDPYSGPEDALSQTTRDQIWNDFIGVAFTRLSAQASLIVNHTRWHEDDIIGRLQRMQELGEIGDEWEFINIVAISVDPDTKEEHALAEWLHPLEQLQTIRMTMQSGYLWWAMYMGSPRARGERLFGEPARYTTLDLTGWRIAIGCDPAATANTKNDASSIVVAAFSGKAHKMRMAILEERRLHVTIPELVDILAATQRTYGGAPLFVEAVAGFKAVPQFLMRMDKDLRVFSIGATADKFLSAQPLAGAWKDERVLVPLQASWVVEYLKVFSTFTGVGDKEDDAVDATRVVWNAMQGVTGLGKPKKGKRRQLAAEGTGGY